VEHVLRLRADLCSDGGTWRGNWWCHHIYWHWLDLAGAILGLGCTPFGLRRLLHAGYAAAGLLSILAALSFGMPWLGATMLVLAALGTEIIDGAGNLLFLRSVHPYERAEMTTVFASFRDVAQLGPPVVCALLLSLFSLSAVFVVAGLMMLASSLLSRRIPRRL
jgi:MFS transporter, ACDE family, multidrug resistance protein